MFEDVDRGFAYACGCAAFVIFVAAFGVLAAVSCTGAVGFGLFGLL